MSSEHYLNSPFVDLTFGGKPDYWRAIVAAWFAFWLAVFAGLLYLYAVVFANAVGFETALLVGVGLLILSSEGDE